MADRCVIGDWWLQWYMTAERKLLRVVDRRVFITPADMQEFIPMT